MSRYQKHTPEGFADLLFPESTKKKRVEASLREVFRTFGYLENESPALEFFDVFDDEFIPTEAMYKFFDQKGRILVLRPDITVPMARIAGSKFTPEELPLRFSYVEKVYRYNEVPGKLREITQAGVECMGVAGIEGDAEVIGIAIEGLFAGGLTEFQLDLGQVDFFKGLVEAGGLSAEEFNTLGNLVDKKDVLGIEDFLDAIPMDDGWKKIFIELPNLYGSLDILEELRAKALPPRCVEALANMEAIVRTLARRGYEKYISVDLGRVRRLNYYTGVIFRGFTHGVGYPIVSGGRYDNLLERFGPSAPAVGCSINVTELMTALERQKMRVEVPAINVLIAAGEGEKDAIYPLAQSLRMSGNAVLEDYVSGDIGKTVEQAAKKGARTVLFLGANDRISQIILESGLRREMSRDEWVLEMEEQKWSI